VACSTNSARDRELDEEIENHLQLHFEDNLRLGMSWVIQTQNWMAIQLSEATHAK
jgi:hypothetical protein